MNELLCSERLLCDMYYEGYCSIISSSESKLVYCLEKGRDVRFVLPNIKKESYFKDIIENAFPGLEKD